MKIATSFTKRFELETLRSEKIRASILAWYSLFTALYVLIVSYLIKNDLGIKDTVVDLPISLFFLLSALFFYEIIANWIVSFRARKFGKSIHPNFKYVNAFIELAIITLMVFVYTEYFNHSPILSDVVLVSLYYLIVFLSAFYVDRYISIVTGIFAAFSYTLLHILNRKINFSGDGLDEILYNKYFIYATGVLLFLSGIAAGVMANRFYKSIERTVKLIEDENKLFNLFSRQISKEVAREILDKDGRVPVERRFVSVMFIDIRNFTVYAETQQPESIVEFQNSFFSIITEQVNKHSGIVNQFLGDGCMVTFGAPVTIGNPAANAVKAALEINKHMNAKIARKEIEPLNLGIGIHCGQAVTGNIGNDVKSEYSITGGVVILAARIESQNKKYHSKILISKEVLDTAGIENLPAIPLGAADLKGWSHPIELYKLA